MGGLEWSALPVAAEIFGIDDIEALVVQLVVLRDWLRDNPPESD